MKEFLNGIVRSCIQSTAPDTGGEGGWSRIPGGELGAFVFAIPFDERLFHEFALAEKSIRRSGDEGTVDGRADEIAEVSRQSSSKPTPSSIRCTTGCKR